jgi:hypothetical protein
LSQQVKLLPALAALAAAAAATVPTASAASEFGFRTPGTAVQCRMVFVGNVWKQFLCFRRDNGFYIRMTGVMTRHPRITKGFSSQLVGRRLNLRVLPYGRAWFSSDAEIVTCRNRHSGLTCTHWRGHGWTLAYPAVTASSRRL